MITVVQRANRVYELAQQHRLAEVRAELAAMLEGMSVADRHAAMILWVDRTAGVLGVVPGQRIELDLAEDSSAEVIHPDLARSSLAWVKALFEARAVQDRREWRRLLMVLLDPGVDAETYLYELVTCMAKTAVAVAEHREVNGEDHHCATGDEIHQHFHANALVTAARRANAILN